MSLFVLLCGDSGLLFALTTTLNSALLNFQSVFCRNLRHPVAALFHLVSEHGQWLAALAVWPVDRREVRESQRLCFFTMYASNYLGSAYQIVFYKTYVSGVTRKR